MCTTSVTACITALTAVCVVAQSWCDLHSTTHVLTSAQSCLTVHVSRTQQCCDGLQSFTSANQAMEVRALQLCAAHVAMLYGGPLLQAAPWALLQKVFRQVLLLVLLVCLGLSGLVLCSYACACQVRSTLQNFCMLVFRLWDLSVCYVNFQMPHTIFGKLCGFSERLCSSHICGLTPIQEQYHYSSKCSACCAGKQNCRK